MGKGKGDDKVASILWRVDSEFTDLTALRVCLPSASLGAATWWLWALAAPHSSVRSSTHILDEEPGTEGRDFETTPANCGEDLGAGALATELLPARGASP